MLAGYAREEARAHLDRHDYAALRATLERARLGRPWHQHVCDYADRRMSFDFRRADAALGRGAATAEGLGPRLEGLRASLRPFLESQTQPTSADGAEKWEAWL